MHWLRQHCDARQIIVVARVSAEPGGYTVALVDSSKGEATAPIDNHYASREAAFTAADAIVRHRYGGHVCGTLCSGWAEDAAKS
jgi:hypothetical protein